MHQQQTQAPPARSEDAERIVQLELRLSVDPGSISPHGHARDETGREHSFHGWLGLLGVLEGISAPAVPPRDLTTPSTARRQPMSTTSNPSVTPIGLQPTQGEALWFLGFLTTIKASTESTDGQVAVIEHLGPRGAGSPLHLHHNEDEWFYVIDGELTFWVGGQLITAPAGSFVYGPKGIPHTFLVSSEQARFLLVGEPAGFEQFMRACSEPAARLEIPPAPTSPPDIAAIAALAAQHGIEILGPPGIPA
jgi:quercetin dioxygenase-like cupin family protein